jgi:Xaa-Pro aminopeptidase
VEANIDGAEKPMDAFETLTLAPIDRRLIDVAQLSAQERAWIDDYHARVRREIKPLVDDEATKVWLDAATKPLGEN